MTRFDAHRRLGDPLRVSTRSVRPITPVAPVAPIALVALVALVALALTACADDSAATSVGTTSTDASSSSSSGVVGSSGETPTTTGADASTSADSSTGADSSAGSSTGDPGFDPPTPACGNGYLEAVEECDDGNRVDGDGCNAACQVPCGLDLELLELAPTAQSTITGIQVATAPNGGFVVIGRVREITVDQEDKTTVGPREVLMTAYDVTGEPRWQQKIGDPMGDLSANGGVVDSDGNVLLIASVDGADGSDIWIGKRAAIDGSELWTKIVDGALPDGDDFGGAVAVTATDDVIAVGQIRDKLNDTDVWVRKLAAADGATVWTTSWSGTPGDGYSIDIGSAVAVAPGGQIHVLAREFVSTDITEVTLLTFGPGGGEPLWTASPLADGSKHKDNPGALGVGPDGEVVLGVARGGFAPTFSLFRLAPGGGKPTWSLAAADFITLGTDWSLTGLGVFPDGSIVVGGSWVDDVSQPDSAWIEVWTARLDADGQKRCQTSYQAPGEDLFPPSVIAASFAASPDGTALATGERIDSEESSLWIGRFRPL